MNSLDPSLESLLASKRVVLCVGAGGVGKTTTSAALALAAAMRGKKVLCLTIDPARRLAQSLGLVELRADAQRIDSQVFQKVGLSVPGSLTVMMLDTKQTFDDIVRRYASSQAVCDRILHNRMYHYVSTALAGTHEYMALEKLYLVKNDPSFDIVILDTPPTSNALDFLDAPDRLIDALDGSATKWFLRAFESTGRFSFDLLAKSAAVALRGVGRFTGQGFLEQVASFLRELHELFGGFTERATEVRSVLRDSSTAYVLVSSPSPAAIREVLYFAQRLTELGMACDGFVVNRIHQARLQPCSPEDVGAALGSAGISLGPDGPTRVLEAIRDEAIQSEADRESLQILEQALQTLSPRPPTVYVPAYPYDVHDVSALRDVSQWLVGEATANSRDQAR